MNLSVLKYNKFINFVESMKSENLGFYFSFFIHLLLLLFIVGIPNFFEPKQISVPTIVPIEILNVADETFIPEEIPKEIEKETKEIKSKKVEKKIIKEKKFNSSSNQEIKKIEIKDKPNVENKLDKEISSKDDFIVKEKKEIPIEMEKEKINIDQNNFETLPSKKIKPKLKPKPTPKKISEKIDSDVVTKAKPKSKPEPEINIATMLKDLRNEKVSTNIDDQEEEIKKEVIKDKNDKLDENIVQLSISEIDLVLQQLSRCFTAPAGAEIEKTMYVKISAKIQRNREVLENSIRIIDTNIPKSSSVYGPITESAMRTLLNPECIPLKLPEDKYNLWKNLTMKFDYSVMRGN
tara:strand:+ start:41 stop:1090 length:1050 start_codon:yes stop_codon:yes gene_type:complete